MGLFCKLNTRVLFNLIFLFVASVLVKYYCLTCKFNAIHADHARTACLQFVWAGQSNPLFNNHLLYVLMLADIILNLIYFSLIVMGKFWLYIYQYNLIIKNYTAILNHPNSSLQHLTVNCIYPTNKRGTISKVV